MLIRKSKVNQYGLSRSDVCDQCIYCWNTAMNAKFRPELNAPLEAGIMMFDSDIEELKRQVARGVLPKAAPRKDCQFWLPWENDILLGHKAEFFHPAAYQADIHMTIEALRPYHERLAVLTKADIRPYLQPREDFMQNLAGMLPKSAAIGVTITTLNEVFRRILEPGALDTMTRIHQLQVAQLLGYDHTWLVAEPIFKGMDLVALLQSVPFVREVYVGCYNDPHDPDPERSRRHREFIAPKALSDREIMAQYRDALMWASENAPQMKIVLKRQLGGRAKTDEIYKEFGMTYES